MMPAAEVITRFSGLSEQPSSRDIRMDTIEAEGDATATQKMLHRFWNEGPVVKFCVGFCVFVLAEVIVYVTLHWIFPII